jgi:outer membrane receptor protein involved in Fe transport
VRAADLALGALAAAVAAVPAAAQPYPPFDIPAGALQQSIVAFGTQSGSTVGVTGEIGGLRGRPVHGRMPPERALRRMLQGTGLQVEVIDRKTFRILRAIVAAPATKPITLSTSYDPAVGEEIVVTASKRQTRIGDYPGAVSIVDGRSGALARSASRGTDALVDSVASLSSTNLGPGRNKLIIRGIADSSFTGPSQAIVGQYLGDVRLNYNAPDPDLSLYDLDRIEVLEGPQGTLYGAGSLGGIVKLVPTSPDFSRWAGSLAAGYLATRSGTPGSDASAMINAPLKDDRIALRLVGYRAISGGYIDDVGRGLRDVNRSKTLGGRASLRARIGDSWTVDLGGLIQNLNGRDSQYAERGLRPYQRSSAIAQPFDNDYRLGEITISRHWAGLDLVSATGVINHSVEERFDATGYPLPTASLFDQKNRIILVTNETRLSRHTSDGNGWLLGTSFISNSERLTRTLGPIGTPRQIAGIRNSVTGGALYGEATVTIARRIQITGGGRVVYSRLAGKLLGLPAGSGDERNRTEKSVLPLLAISWRPDRKLTVYARYQEGYRGGGLSVAATDSGVTSQRFRGDSIATFEAGARFGDPTVDTLSGAVGFTFAHWEHIQADLVDSSGLPYTANIGNGRTLGMEAKAGWRPTIGLSLEASLFLNDSDLTRPDQGFTAFRHAELPDVARVGGRAAFNYRTFLRGGLNLSIDGSARYFGHSKLGVGTGLDLLQGGYTDTLLGFRIGSDRIGVSIDATNLFDSHDNRFSLGNPFGVMLGRQITPQRPRTIRFGIDGRF